MDLKSDANKAVCDPCFDRLGFNTLVELGELKEVSIDEWGAVELARIESACKAVDDLLNNKELWEDAQVAGLELSDAIDDFNDTLRECERVMRERGVLPAWVPFELSGKTDTSVRWDGQCLWYDDGMQSTALLKSSKKVRLAAAGSLPKLLEKCLQHPLVIEGQ